MNKCTCITDLAMSRCDDYIGTSEKGIVVCKRKIDVTEQPKTDEHGIHADYVEKIAKLVQDKSELADRVEKLEEVLKEILQEYSTMEVRTPIAYLRHFEKAKELFKK